MNIMRIGDARQCIEEEEIMMNTWILDPPYNIGFDYQSDFKDNKKPDVYASDLVDIIHTCARSLQPDGSLFIIHYPEIISRLVDMIESDKLKQCDYYVRPEHQLELHQWITWVYPSNIGHSKSKFTRASRAILWFKKRGQKPYFNHLATVQPYRNPNDKRIKQRIADGHKGVVHYDWWEINMCKNVSKDYRGYVNQIPYKLLERLILHTTEKGDWVGDCFAGSGSTIAAAHKLGRNGWGCDINREMFTAVRRCSSECS